MAPIPITLVQCLGGVIFNVFYKGFEQIKLLWEVLNAFYFRGFSEIVDKFSGGCLFFKIYIVSEDQRVHILNYNNYNKYWLQS